MGRFYALVGVAVACLLSAAGIAAFNGSSGWFWLCIGLFAVFAILAIVIYMRERRQRKAASTGDAQKPSIHVGSISGPVGSIGSSGDTTQINFGTQPRTLAGRAWEPCVKRLSQYSGTIVDFEWIAESESESLANEIKAMIRQAGWATGTQAMVLQPMPQCGITVRVPAADLTTVPALDALADALTGLGFPVTVELNAASAGVFVGPA
jgi:hypothetical protein